jgi:hypothetical protein
MADGGPLLASPSLSFPATVPRPVDDNATVPFRGNRYSAPLLRITEIPHPRSLKFPTP